MPAAEKASETAQVVERNIEALLSRRREEENHKPFETRLVDAITSFAGSMRFVAFHLMVFAAWLIINLGWTRVPRFDPSFAFLAMGASVEAIFLSTFILMRQNHMTELTNKRADLDLHISLLAEHEITRLLTIAQSIAERMGVDTTEDPEMAELVRDIAPEKVLDTMERHEKKIAAG